MDVLHIDGTGKQRRNLPWREARNAAADACDQEGQFGVLLGEGDELVDVRCDGVHATLHGGNGIALALQTHTLPHNGTEFHNSDAGSSATMRAGQVTPKDENLVFAKFVDTVGCNAIAELAHATVVAVFAV